MRSRTAFPVGSFAGKRPSIGGIRGSATAFVNAGATCCDSGAKRKSGRKLRPTGRSAREAHMPYDLDHFIADCRTSPAPVPGPPGREEVAKRLEVLLGNPDFVREYGGDDAPSGVKILYEAPKLGFRVLSHCYDSPRVSPPHDHGASWAIYGQAVKYTDMTEWERNENGGPAGHADLKP